MLKLTEFAPPDAEATETVVLGFDERQKSRLRARLQSGAEVGILLPRGMGVLRNGLCLTGAGGVVVRIRAAEEQLSVARTADSLTFARACYHLGNRHVPLEIRPGEVRYRQDHVLDEMVRSLGLDVTAESAAFEPEPGAYAPLHGHSPIG